MPSQNFTAVDQFVDINVNSKKILVVQVAGNFNAFVAFRTSVNNTDFASLSISPASNSDLQLAAVNVPGIFKANVEGYKTVKLLCVAFTSGPVMVTWETD